MLKNLKRGGPVQNFYYGQGYLPTIATVEGIYLYDTNGKKYLDASSGPVTCNLGHGNKVVLEATDSISVSATGATDVALSYMEIT